MSITATPNPIPYSSTTTDLFGSTSGTHNFVRITEDGISFATDSGTDRVSTTATFSAQNVSHTYVFEYSEDGSSWTADGSVTVRRGLNNAIASSISPSSTAGGTRVNLARPLASSIAGAATMGAPRLSAALKLQASIAPAATITARLNATVRFIGSAAGVSTPTFALAVLKTFSATIAGASTIVSNVDRNRGLASSIAGASTIVSNVDRRRGLASSIAGVATAGGTRVNLARPLAASAAGATTISAVMRALWRLVSTSAGVATAGGTRVNLARPLAASIAPVATVTATMRAAWRLVAQADGDTFVAGDLVMVTVYYPTSDISAGSWITAPLYAKLDENPYDTADYVEVSPSDTGETFEVQLGTTSEPPSRLYHTVQYVIGKASTSNRYDFAVKLVEGTTIIAAWTHTDVASGFTYYTQDLTSVQAESIVDYADLRLRFTVTLV